MNDLGYPAARKRPRRPLQAAVVIAVVCGFLAAIVVLWWPRTTVVTVLHQPTEIAYSDGSQHVAVLRHIRAPIAAIGVSASGFSTLDHYEVVLGRDPGGDYGHRVSLDATGVDPADLSVRWTPDGAWLTYRSGHRVFVPVAFFTGGR